MKAGAVKCENGELSFVDPEHAASAGTPQRKTRIRKKKEKNGNPVLTFFVTLLQPVNVSPSDSPYESGKIASEYFYDNTGDSEAVSLLDTYVDFGSCSRFRVIDSQVVRISNNTKGKMSCVWIMPGETTG